MMLVHFLCLLLSVRMTIQAATPTSPIYKGAVVEYYPVTKGDNGTAIANENAENYLKFLKKADAHEVDIIVFPEGSLTAGKSFPAEERTQYLPHSSYVPDPKDLEIPCKNDSSTVMKALQSISCAAKQYAMYIVVNVREKAKCMSDATKTCSTDGHDLYNTNVVFDRRGAIVARYRKFNLFTEPGFNVTSKPELSTFKTDFNVTFGQIICFDILFERPALQLLREANVTDVLFSTMWFSELPFLTAPEIQSAWSYANNVYFLASGYNNPETGTGGSGIYGGNQGPVTNMWSEKRVNALLMSDIPKNVNGRRHQRQPSEAVTYIFPPEEMATIKGREPVPQQRLLSDDIGPYTTQLIPPTNGTYTLTLCDRGLCCDFTTDTTYIESANRNNANHYRYRFAVFNGVRSFSDVRTGGIELCSIISCTDDTDMSCAQRFDTNEIIVHHVTFNSIIISGNFSTGTRVLRMPIGMNTDIQPLNASDISFATTNLNDTHVNIKYTLRRSCKGLMTFAIWGRNFTRDGEAKTTRSSGSQSSPFVFMLMILAVLGIGSIYAMGPLPNGA